MGLPIHPNAELIHQLKFSGRKITFKEVERQDKLHTCSGYHNEKWIEHYDRTNLPYFICSSFKVYKNEYDIQNKEKKITFIIKVSPCRKYKFPNNEKLRLSQFNKDINIFNYNKIQPENDRYERSDIFDMFCRYFY